MKLKRSVIARNCYGQQSQLAKHNYSDAKRRVDAYKEKLENDFDFPIKFERLGSTVDAGGTARSVWDQPTECKHHSIDLAPSDSWLKPAAFAHELIHIDLECQANAAKVRKTLVVMTTHQEMWDLYGLKPHESALLGKLSGYLKNVAVDMIVNASLLENFPLLKPALFVRAYDYHKRNSDFSSLIPDASPKFKIALDALRAASALFADKQYGSEGNLFAPFRDSLIGDIAEKLYEAFEDGFPLVSPKGHYDLVGRFSEILGFPSLLVADSRPLWIVLQGTR
jgi:hypothetical protein